MRYEYRFCLPYQRELTNALNEEKVKYRLSGPIGDQFSDGTPVPVFVIFEFKQYSPLVEELSAKYRYRPQISVIYSATEINTAQLLWMTPKKQYVDITNSQEAFSFSCSWSDRRGISRSHHKEQIAPFAIENEPSTKSKTAFWASSTGFSEIFTDRRVKDLVVSNNLQGVEFLYTILRDGSYSNNIFQLTTHNKITSEYIVLGKGEKEITCPICGKKQYAFNAAYQLTLDLPGVEITEDLYVTERIFGEGIARPIYLISQRFYQLLKKYKLTSNVTFDPVTII